jgi:small nuclear ribonucleoprotein (snRNP)-like protein
MSMAMRMLWLVTLMFFTAGCSGYRVACKPKSDVPGDLDQYVREFCGLKPDDKVRINLVDGEKVDGVIQSVSSQDIVLIPDANKDNPLSFASSEILSIEEKKSYTVYKIVGVVLLAGIVFAGVQAVESI